jgi:hypothetical protein
MVISKDIDFGTLKANKLPLYIPVFESTKKKRLKNLLTLFY